MISKLKSILKSKSSRKVVNIQGITNKVSSGLFDMMEKSFAQKQQEISANQFSPSNPEKIIEGYTRKNMALAAASSVVPGPLGILSAVPQLVISFGNQMKMIYDIGIANGRQNIITKDVLLDIPIAAFGGQTNLSSLQQSTNLNSSGMGVLQDKAFKLGQSVVQQTMKKSVVQFIPVAGSVMMGVWAKMSTQKISKSASDFFSPDKIYRETIAKNPITPEVEDKLQIEKIKLICNLVECNRDINEKELETLATIIANSSIPEKEQPSYLGEALMDNILFEIDYDFLTQYGEHQDTIMEMAVMARRDGAIDEAERAYIYEAGNQLNIPKKNIDELMGD